VMPATDFQAPSRRGSPEEERARRSGAHVSFTYRISGARLFGTVARSAHALDPKNRTMAVELDVTNVDGSLSPGMYPTVKWPVRRSRAALLVPASSVVTTTERTFCHPGPRRPSRVVDVRKGAAEVDS